MMRDHDGAEVDATAHSENYHPTGVELVYESRGGGRNNDYAAGLELILSRILHTNGRVTLAQVDVDSRKGTWTIFDIGNTTQMLNAEPDKARRELCRRAAKAGRAPDAKGSGNGTKRLRLWLWFEVPGMFTRGETDAVDQWIRNDPPAEHRE